MNALLRSCMLSALALASLAGCTDEKTAVTADDAGVADGGPSKQVLGGKLAAAVAAASSARAVPKDGGAAGDGPPETGIFPPGGADATLAPGAPAKIEVMDAGPEPRVQLAFAPSGDEQQAMIEVGLMLGPQQGLPTIDFGLAFKFDKSGKTVAKVVSATLGKKQPGQVPRELGDKVAKVKGSEIRFQLTPEGGVTDTSVTLSKDAEPTLETALRAAAESLSVFAAPVPKAAVGVGGFWMVTDRGTAFGVDVVRYRVFRVQKIEKGKATLSLELRQYAVKEDIDLGAVAGGQKIKLDRFDAQGKGTVVWAQGALIPAGSEASSRTRLVFGGRNGQGGRPLSIESASSTQEPDSNNKKK